MSIARLRSWTDWSSIVLPVIALLSTIVVLVSEDVSGWWLATALAGLLPWMLLAGGVPMWPEVFVILVVVPATALGLHGTMGGVFLVLFAGVWLGTVAVPRWYAWATAAIAAALSTVAMVIVHDGFDKGALYFQLGAVLTLVCSELMRRERTLVRELGVARDELSERAAEHERARIAREIHDVVGHSLTVVQLHVAGARRQLKLDPSLADAALARAEEIGRESLDHLRQVVELLRTNDDGAVGASPPLPRASDVPALVESVREAGLDVSLAIDGDLADVEDAVGLCVYRVVQESLANARHHAPGSPVSVDLKVRRCHSLDVVVRNPAAAAVAGAREGTGLTGMRERIAACQGVLTAGRQRDTWVVRARLPLSLVRA